MNASINYGCLNDSGRRDGDSSKAGALIINADDWGRDRKNTDRIHECILRGTVSSVSAMVFMEDSERAAATAQEKGIDAGLHLNFTTPFSSGDCPAPLAEHQRKTAAYLLRHRFAGLVYHPGLARSFEYVVAAQMDQFNRIYERVPNRLDGHRHMHLCANVLLGRLLPSGTIVRRNFCFARDEKGMINRAYRRILDRFLARRHRIVDYFSALSLLEHSAQVQRIFSLGHQFVVELETHPVEQEEFRFLMSDEILTQAGTIQIARAFDLA